MTKGNRNITVAVILGIVLLLIGLRIYLPTYIMNHVNRSLDEIPGYSGSISGVDLALIRGAFRVNDVKIEKTDADLPVPFVEIETIDSSIEWGALFNGRVVGELVLVRPVVNFAIDSTMQQTGENVDWTEPIKDMIPLQINRFAVTDGSITFFDFGTEPSVDISLDSLQFEALNLSNIERSDSRLPSRITGSAFSIGGGHLHLECDANILKQIPDFDMSLEFESVHLPALNEFTEAYANLDFERGTFNLYTEMAVSDGILKGYVRPILTDVEVVEAPEEDDSILEIVWEGVAGTLISIFTNPPTDRFATEVPIEGDLNNPEISIWPTIANIYRNAFVDAFEMETEGSVSFDDMVD